jgi:iron complex outermembrane receptor protein
MEEPQRVEVVNKSNLESIPSLSADNFLMTIPGINVSRGSSIFGSGNVSLRGMGNEAGRTLVMIDGVPINKGDGGSVNWNAINYSELRQIEVLKGPGSTIHGGNAMGGVINLITPLPTKPLEGYISQSVGMFSTLQTTANIQGLKNKVFWSLNGSYRNSDGYITTPVDETDEYTVPSFLNEYNIGGKVGYLLTQKSRIEVAGGYYSGQRGTGTEYKGYNFENDEFASEKGSYNLYEMFNSRIVYTGNFDANSSLKLTFYTQRENYNNIKESLKSNIITRYDVLSKRDDFGFLSGYTFSPSKSHTLSMGIDARYSEVDAADTYITVTDNVINRGTMKLAGLYLQDEININRTAFSLIAGVRLDIARFDNGAFLVENPTNETAFLEDFTGDLDAANFSAFSPRLAVQYYKPEKIRVYTGYSRGYRAPVLDDMCRTGRISGGMKIANPELGPEYLDNIEIGTDIFPGKKLSITTSLFYSLGTDYHAYVSTGDSIFLNKKLRPIMKKSNISKVEIYGIEAGLKYAPVENFICQLSYSFINTNVLDFSNNNTETELTGKGLVYQPKDIFNLSATWKNKIVNASVLVNYKGNQFTNDVNSESIDSYYYVDMQLWRTIYKGLNATFMVQNLLDNEFIDSRNVISPGRMISLQVKYTLK